MRLNFLTVMPSPYTRDLLEALASHPRIRLQVRYMEMQAPDTYWGDVDLPSHSQVLPGRWFGVAGARVHFNPTVLRSFRQTAPDLVIVGGYASATCQLAMAWLTARRIPWIFHGELPGVQNEITALSAPRLLAQRPVAWWASGVAAVGSKAASEYQRLTSGRCPVHNIPYYCAVEPFRQAKLAAPAHSRGVHFLYCGQLITRKGVDLLVRTFIRIAADDPDTRLTLVGEGPLREQLGQMVPSGLGHRVRFAGFQQPPELPRLFAEADVFILPSRHDGWGVVVNQALAAGLPIIASNAVGAAADLVHPGRNGFTFPAGDDEALFQAMRAFVQRPELVAKFGAESFRCGEGLTPERGAERWYQLCCEVLGRPGGTVVGPASSAPGDGWDAGC